MKQETFTLRPRSNRSKVTGSLSVKLQYITAPGPAQAYVFKALDILPLWHALLSRLSLPLALNRPTSRCCLHSRWLPCPRGVPSLSQLSLSLAANPPRPLALSSPKWACYTSLPTSPFLSY